MYHFPSEQTLNSSLAYSSIPEGFESAECDPVSWLTTDSTSCQKCCSSRSSTEEEFELETILYERSGSKVVLSRSPIEDLLSIAKITQIPTQNTSALAHLKFEVEFTRKILNCPMKHLACITGLIETQNQVIRTMPYACRGDLTQCVPSTWNLNTKQQKLIHLGTVQNIISQVLAGLEQIHSLNYVYRDLKPANVLITHDGNAVLCDFGLVAPIGTIDGSICGTPEYMAPERLSNKRNSCPVDTNIDMWALGVLTFELLMGFTPYEFEDNDLQGLLENIYGGYLEFDEDYPQYVKQFVFSLIQTNPNKRMTPEQARKHVFLAQVQERALEGSGCKCSNTTS